MYKQKKLNFFIHLYQRILIIKIIIIIIILLIIIRSKIINQIQIIQNYSGWIFQHYVFFRKDNVVNYSDVEINT